MQAVLSHHGLPQRRELPMREKEGAGVSYEAEVGQRGPKAVNVQLI